MPKTPGADLDPPAAGAPTNTLEWVAHPPFARAFRTPTASELADARRAGCQWIEIDVNVTRDGVLVVRHDPMYWRWRPVSAVTFKQLREQVPHTLTLDQAVNILGPDTRLLLDIKSQAAARALGPWLGANAPPDRFTVCARDPLMLGGIGEHAPHTPRWMSLPELPDVSDRRRSVRYLTTVLRTERDPRAVAAVVGDVALAIAQGHDRLRHSARSPVCAGAHP